ncbi:MAG: hypothetical protein HFI97_00050 [Lachnospiraceae bacterium]|nr:hypothetical protein [Lachnospiraceae bacterium]
MKGPGKWPSLKGIAGKNLQIVIINIITTIYCGDDTYYSLFRGKMQGGNFVENDPQRDEKIAVRLS